MNMFLNVCWGDNPIWGGDGEFRGWEHSLTHVEIPTNAGAIE